MRIKGGIVRILMCFDELIQRYESINSKLQLVISEPQYESMETIHSLDVQLNEVLDQILDSGIDIALRTRRIRFCVKVLETQVFIDETGTNRFTETIKSDCDYIDEKLRSRMSNF